MFKELLDSLLLLLTGMALVLFTLALIYGLCALVGRFFVKAHTEHEPPPATPPVEAKQEAEDPQVPVVIAAAITQLLDGKQFRIVTIKSTRNSDWPREGRLSIFNSHQRIL